MIKKISLFSNRHPFISLVGLTAILNFYVKELSQTVDHIQDPIARQFYQNLFICLLCILASIGAVVLVHVCNRRAEARTNSLSTDQTDQIAAQVLYNVIVPGLMMFIVLGCLWIILHLQW